MSYIVNVINAQTNEVAQTLSLDNDCQIYKFLTQLKSKIDLSNIVEIVTDSGQLYKKLLPKRLANNDIQFLNIAPATCAAHKTSTNTNVTISKIEIYENDNPAKTLTNIKNNCQLYKFCNELKSQLTATNIKIVVYDLNDNVIKTLVSKIQFVEIDK